MEQENTQVQFIPEDKEKTKKILRVALILGVVTAIEFIIALLVPSSLMPHSVKVFVYIALTIVKAFYIVAEFMHLGHEKKSLMMSILLPMLFVIFLIFILMYQGSAIFEILN